MAHLTEAQRGHVKGPRLHSEKAQAIHPDSLAPRQPWQDSSSSASFKGLLHQISVVRELLHLWDQDLRLMGHYPRRNLGESEPLDTVRSPHNQFTSSVTPKLSPSQSPFPPSCSPETLAFCVWPQFYLSLIHLFNKYLGILSTCQAWKGTQILWGDRRSVDRRTKDEKVSGGDEF